MRGAEVALRFPVVVENTAGLGELAAALDWVQTRREHWVSALRADGALLFRGFPLETAEDFDAWVRAFDRGTFSYRDSLSNAVRVDLTDRVFTANEAPPEATIRLHHELAQTPAHPRDLFLFCEKPAERGGATALCRSDRVFEAIARRLPDFAQAAEVHGLRYRTVMPPEDDPASALGRSWRGTLSVRSRGEAETKLAQLGYTWTWSENDCLAATTPRLPAVLALGDGRRTFFNQLVATRSWSDERNDPERAVWLGNGAPISLDLRDAVAEETERLDIDLDWQKGDVAILDNHLAMHGRRSFEGSRRVLVAFSARAELP
jgi:alpha-ketoglutarate-dependent taurine dioxygenase